MKAKKVFSFVILNVKLRFEACDVTLAHCDDTVYFEAECD